MHASKKGKAQGLAAKQPSARKVATIAGILGLAAMLGSTLALRSQLSDVVEGIKKAGLGEASLGSGFNRELCVFVNSHIQMFGKLTMTSDLRRAVRWSCVGDRCYHLADR